MNGTRKKMDPCVTYYSDHIKECTLFVPFVVGELLSRQVLHSTSLVERLTVIYITITFFNTSRRAWSVLMSATTTRCLQHNCLKIFPPIRNIPKRFEAYRFYRSPKYGLHQTNCLSPKLKHDNHTDHIMLYGQICQWSRCVWYVPPLTCRSK